MEKTIFHKLKSSEIRYLNESKKGYVWEEADNPSPVGQLPTQLEIKRRVLKDLSWFMNEAVYTKFDSVAIAGLSIGENLLDR